MLLSSDFYSGGTWRNYTLTKIPNMNMEKKSLLYLEIAAITCKKVFDESLIYENTFPLNN